MLFVSFGALISAALVFIENFYSFLFFRFIKGIFIGLFSSINPLIINEIAPKEIRGSLGSYTQLNVGFGVFFSCLYAYALKRITGDLTGRDFLYYLYGLPLIPMIVQIIVLIFVFPYETPKYLLSIGKEEEARQLIEVIYK